MRRYHIAAGAICAIALTSTSVGAKNKHEAAPPMPAGYDDPGPAPHDVLSGILGKLQQRLYDPESIRDVTMCEPRSTPAFLVGDEWEPAEWIVQFTLNAKNRSGGYTGSIEYTAYIKDGLVKEVSETPPISMIVESQRSSYVTSAAACPRVPNAEIQKMLNW